MPNTLFDDEFSQLPQLQMPEWIDFDETQMPDMSGLVQGLKTRMGQGNKAGKMASMEPTGKASGALMGGKAGGSSL